MNYKFFSKHYLKKKLLFSCIIERKKLTLQGKNKFSFSIILSLNGWGRLQGIKTITFK